MHALLRVLRTRTGNNSEWSPYARRRTLFSPGRWYRSSGMRSYYITWLQTSYFCQACTSWKPPVVDYTVPSHVMERSQLPRPSSSKTIFTNCEPCDHVTTCTPVHFSASIGRILRDQSFDDVDLAGNTFMVEVQKIIAYHVHISQRTFDFELLQLSEDPGGHHTLLVPQLRDVASERSSHLFSYAGTHKHLIQNRDTFLPGLWALERAMGLPISSYLTHHPILGWFSTSSGAGIGRPRRSLDYLCTRCFVLDWF